MRNGRRGFTLYELTLTVLLVALLAGIATPGLAKLLARQQQTVEINTLLGAVYLARKESILKRRVATLCPSHDFRSCASDGDWSGWILFINEDRDSPPVVDPGEDIIKTHQVSENIKILSNRAGFAQRATRLRATNGTLVFCHRRGLVPSKALVISFTGRPRVANHTTRGEHYACAH